MSALKAFAEYGLFYRALLRKMTSEDRETNPGFRAEGLDCVIM